MLFCSKVDTAGPAIVEQMVCITISADVNGRTQAQRGDPGWCGWFAAARRRQGRARVRATRGVRWATRGCVGGDSRVVGYSRVEWGGRRIGWVAAEIDEEGSPCASGAGDSPGDAGMP